MKMDVWFLITVGIVLEKRHGQIACRDNLFLSRAHDSRLGGVLLCPSQSFGDGAAIGINDPFVAANELYPGPLGKLNYAVQIADNRNE